VVFPGGFGTLDEMFEILTLAQTGKLMTRIQVVLYGSSYWKSVVNFEFLIQKGAIAREDLNLFHFADTPEEAFALLREGLAPYTDTPVAEDSGPSAQDLGPAIQHTVG
jgi:predicted Rossmann-fold nucleotide-binding protein